jgi:drug/metabolite transporter (DMT)-like permease
MIVLVAGFIITLNYSVGLDYSEISTVSAVFTLITVLMLIVFFRGRNRDPAGQTMHTLVAISIKFLSELIFAFVWFFAGKKTGISSVVLFFVLYLTFTMFSITVILKTLKSKSLE